MVSWLDCQWFVLTSERKGKRDVGPKYNDRKSDYMYKTGLVWWGVFIYESMSRDMNMVMSMLFRLELSIVSTLECFITLEHACTGTIVHTTGHMSFSCLARRKVTYNYDSRQITEFYKCCLMRKNKNKTQ